MSLFRYCALFAALFISSHVIAVNVSELLLVRVEAFRSDESRKTVDTKTLATWIVPKSKTAPAGGLCDVTYGIFLDDAKARVQLEALFKKELADAKDAAAYLTEDMKTKPALRAMFESGQNKLEDSMKLIDNYKYIVRCTDISPGSSMEHFFDFDKSTKKAN